MEWFFDTLSTVFIFIAALFILVIVHELGHFLAARLFKMRVERFSVGFPPRIAGIKIGDTDYCVSATPLGGYVKISGMIDESMENVDFEKEPEDWEFRAKPVWQRMIVISAGVIFNVILGIIIYSGINFAYGDFVVPAENVGSLYISETSLAHEVGFRTGDEILTVNGKRITNFGNDVFSLENLTTENLEFTVLRNGESVSIRFPEGFLDRLAKENGPLFSIANALPSQISGIVKGSVAEAAGLEANDKIVGINSEHVSFWMQVVERVRGAEDPLLLEIERSGSQFSITVVPDSQSRTIGIYPVNVQDYFGVKKVDYTMGESMYAGFSQALGTMSGIVNGLKQIATGSLSVQENLGGPIAIASVTREVTDAGGLRGFWVITAYLSITLAIMNILPLPILDGGHLVFLMYEGITRREPSPKFRMAIQQFGLLLFILIFLFVTYNDIMRALF